MTKDLKVDINQILALVNYYTSNNRASEAVELLRKAQEIFDIEKQSNIWVLAYANALIMEGSPHVAVQYLDENYGEHDIGLVRIKSTALRHLAKESNNWDRLLEYLEKEYGELKIAEIFLEICEIKCELRDWLYVADSAEELIEQVNTAEAVRLAAIACFNAKQYDKCLKVLDKNIKLFSDKKLPAALKSLQIVSKSSLGLLPEAIEDAEKLAIDYPYKENLITLAQTYLDVGDLKSLTIISRKIFKKFDLSAAESLNLAKLTKLEDSSLAIQLWRAALNKGIPDAYIVSAMIVGYELGLDKEMKPILERLPSLSDRELSEGGIKYVTLEEIIPLVKEKQEERKKVIDNYRQGDIPIHFTAAAIGTTIFNIYHELLFENQNKENLLHKPIIFARHGGKALPLYFQEGRQEWVLVLDITSILLAESLGVLEIIEKKYCPLKIPESVIKSLIYFQDKLTNKQVSKKKDYKRILSHVKNNKIQVVQAQEQTVFPINEDVEREITRSGYYFLHEAIKQNARLVLFSEVYEKVRSIEPSIIENITNPKVILKSLREFGPLSKSEYDYAAETMRQDNDRTVDEHLIPHGTVLFLDEIIAEHFSEAEILEGLVENYKVKISENEFQRIKAEDEYFDSVIYKQTWLKQLTNRVAQGIQDGSYKVVVPENSASRMKSPESNCIEEILLYKPEPKDVLWVDDRLFNSYSQREGVPIIGINEVLKALYSSEAIDKSVYFDALTKLRRANVRFIPIEAEEIIYQLESAYISDATDTKQKHVTDTVGLKTLREYIAACILQGGLIQRPPMPARAPNEQGEIFFLLSTSKSIVDAIINIWDSSFETSICELYSGWVLENLYLDHLAQFKIAGLPRKHEDERYLTAVSLAGFLLQGVKFNINRDDSRRKLYFDWVYRKLLKVKFKIEPYLFTAVIDFLKKSLHNLYNPSEESEKQQVALLILQEYYNDLPEPIKVVLREDSDFLKSLGLKTLSYSSVEDINFDQEQFWEAISASVDGNTTKILSSEQIEFTVLPAVVKSPNLSIKLIDPKGEEIVITDQKFLALSSISDTIKEFMLSKRSLFDLSQKESKKIISEILAVTSPFSRMQFLDQKYKESLDNYYDELCQQLSEKQSYDFRNLSLPPLISFLKYFRVCSNTSVLSFDRGIQTLIKEENIKMVLRRLAGLPKALPENVIESFKGLNHVEQKKIIKAWLKWHGSPVSHFHLLKLLQSIASDFKPYQRLARRLVNRFFKDDYMAEVTAFLSINKWVSRELEPVAEFHKLPTEIRFAIIWSHSHQLFDIFRTLGVPSGFLYPTFSSFRDSIPLDTFSRDIDFWHDIAHPRQMNPELLLFAGLAYGLKQSNDDEVIQALKSGFLNIAIKKAELVECPTPTLLVETTLCKNSLQTFLGGDLGKKISNIIDFPDLKNFKAPALRNIVEESLSKINDDNYPSWLLLQTVLHDLPIYEDLSDDLFNILRTFDFQSGFKKEPINTNVGIYFACAQAINYLNHDLNLYLEQQLLSIFKDMDVNVSTDVLIESGTKDVYLLIEAALNLAIASLMEQEPAARFSVILEQVAGIPAVNTWYKPLLLRFCEELPIKEAQYFWKSLLLMRIY